MNITNIASLLKMGISRENLWIPERTLKSFENKMLISAWDMTSWNIQYSLEGAVKLKIYEYIKKFGISMKRLQEIEKEYRNDSRELAKFLTVPQKEFLIKNHLHKATILTYPILITLAKNRQYVTLDTQNFIEYMSELDFIGIVSFWKDTGDTLNGKILIDIGVLIESLWIDVRKHSKGTINKMIKFFEENKLPVLNKKWKYQITKTTYYSHPRELPDRILNVLSKPNTKMTLKSNNAWVVTNIILNETEILDSDKI